MTSFAPILQRSRPRPPSSRLTFDPRQSLTAAPAASPNFTGTYSYLIAPDDGRACHRVADPAIRHRPGRPAGHRPGAVDNRAPPRSPPRARAAPAPPTTSRRRRSRSRRTIPISSSPASRSTCRSHHQRASDLTITLVAPDGRSTIIFQGSSNGPLNFANTPFVVNNPQRRPG